MDLNYDNLLGILFLANKSERTQEQNSAEEQLKQWESYPGFHYFLQEVYLKTDLPLQVRWLAIICFKNGVDKHWRSTRSNAISRQEKEKIKLRLFDLTSERNNQLTIQNAYATARIARFDFPIDWPELFEFFTNKLEETVFRTNDLISTNNILLILNQVIKSISMVRIGRARHAMQAKAPIIVPTLVKLYSHFFPIWASNLDLGMMEVCYLCLKVLRRIIPEGFENPHKNQDLKEFFGLTVQHLQGLILEHDKYSSDLLERYVKCYSKLYLNLINNNPTSFVLLPSSKDILTSYTSLLAQRSEDVYNSTDENNFWEVLALKGLLILKKIVTYIYKKGAVTLRQNTDKNEIYNAINMLSTQFFTPEVIQELCDLVITWYLRLRPSDIEGWLLEPEEWCNEDLSSSWEYQIRPCAEVFFQDLITYFKDILSDFVLNKISEGMTSCETLETVLSKDSLLCAFQLFAISLADRVEFDRFLVENLIPEALNTQLEENKIIRRRICLIISEWVLVKCSRESRVSVFKLLYTFLQPNQPANDKIVKLTAVQTLRIVLDDWDFNKSDFEPFLKDIVVLLLSAVSEMDLTESKLYVFSTLSVLISRCNPIVDHQTLRGILAIIPDYWKSITNQNETILQNSLLRLLKNVVIALNENSIDTYDIALPLIISSSTERAAQYALLSEDGYELWLAVVQYYPNTDSSKNPDILSLFSNLEYGIANSTEILSTLLAILRSYALIMPSLLNSNEGYNIFKLLASYLPKMRDDSFSIFVSTMDILFLSQTNDQRFMQVLIESGLLEAMFQFTMDLNQSIVAANKIYLILSRLAYESPESMISILQHFFKDPSRFMNQWLEYYNSYGNPRHKKTNLLAFMSLMLYAIPRKIEFFISTFGQVAKKSFYFLEEVNETDEGSCSVYNVDTLYEEIDEYCYMDPTIKPHGEKIRYANLLDAKDPTNKRNFQKVLEQTLSELRPFLSSLVSSCDQYTTEKLQSTISM
ncbi:Piso0_002737 [Millerozyma farinosa CBS 7064]|uniref:Piso0_002737 protein n=1 Tax=Pichia sorbitophila (strain ATCC MYA-4447 / BCRC 22081 / CBS 7064 / NBRC 10061 / NRRL Y-12695) TaxID=559304 RepID=G8YDD6_PICSO|nr:Piso0_002737 [Millerozyma farinosa CBS 7064]